MYKLEALKPDQLPLLYRLAEEIWLPTFSPLFSEKELQSLYQGMYNDDALKAWMDRPGCTLYIIYTAPANLPNGQIHRPEVAIGYMGIEHTPDSLKLDKIYVHPRLQGQGVGSWAVEQVMAFAKNAGCERITLRVNRRNTAAIAFYNGRGFVIDAEVDYPAPNGFTYEDYLMSKSL